MFIKTRQRYNLKNASGTLDRWRPVNSLAGLLTGPFIGHFPDLFTGLKPASV
jgi:hypothetical protein